MSERDCEPCDLPHGAKRNPYGPAPDTDCGCEQQGLGLCNAKPSTDSLFFLAGSRGNQKVVEWEVIDTAVPAQGIGVGDLRMAKQEHDYFVDKADTANQDGQWFATEQGFYTDDDAFGNPDTSDLCYLVWGVRINTMGAFQAGINPPVQAPLTPIYFTNATSPDAAELRQLVAATLRNMLFTLRIGNKRTEAVLGLGVTLPGWGDLQLDGETRAALDALPMQYTATTACFVISGSPLVNSSTRLTLRGETIGVDVVIEASAANPFDPDRGPVRVVIRASLIGAVICCPPTAMCQPPKRSDAEKDAKGAHVPGRA